MRKTQNCLTISTCWPQNLPPSRPPQHCRGGISKSLSFPTVDCQAFTIAKTGKRNSSSSTAVVRKVAPKFSLKHNVRAHDDTPKPICAPSTYTASTNLEAKEVASPLWCQVATEVADMHAASKHSRRLMHTIVYPPPLDDVVTTKIPLTDVAENFQEEDFCKWAPELITTVAAQRITEAVTQCLSSASVDTPLWSSKGGCHVS